MFLVSLVVGRLTAAWPKQRSRMRGKEAAFYSLLSVAT